MTSSRRCQWGRMGASAQGRACPTSSLTSRPGGGQAQLRHRPLIYWTRNTYRFQRICPGDSPGSPRSLQEYLYKAVALPPGRGAEDTGSHSCALAALPVVVACWDQPCPGQTRVLWTSERLQPSQPTTPRLPATPPAPPRPQHRAILLTWALPRLLPAHPPLSDASPWAGGRRRGHGCSLWTPLLTQACLACCKDQSQTPRVLGPTSEGDSDVSELLSVPSVAAPSACLMPRLLAYFWPAAHTALPLGVLLLESILGGALAFPAAQRIRGSHPSCPG